ncbi:hypothetical protein [Pseudomonas petrae]|uniref:hypothetical protein n=1 Tax=Pseudomonas petrae TaxID=2912190 RepID=UPI001F3B3D8C|nr:hypothetical protein [Pseudomonas petrae]MCF7532011.1 hypothetical protein [Pseudomonas petrae]
MKASIPKSPRVLQQRRDSEPAYSFFVLQVFDGRGVYGFGLGLTDKALAAEMLEVLGRDLLGRRVELTSLCDVPQGFGEISQHRVHTSEVGSLMKRASAERSPGRAFLVAYVENFKRVMPLSQTASMLEHAKYEPDHEKYAYVPLHESAIGRAFP